MNPDKKEPSSNLTPSTIAFINLETEQQANEIGFDHPGRYFCIFGVSEDDSKKPDLLGDYQTVLLNILNEQVPPEPSEMRIPVDNQGAFTNPAKAWVLNPIAYCPKQGMINSVLIIEAFKPTPDEVQAAIMAAETEGNGKIVPWE